MSELENINNIGHTLETINNNLPEGSDLSGKSLDALKNIVIPKSPEKVGESGKKSHSGGQEDKDEDQKKVVKREGRIGVKTELEKINLEKEALLADQKSKKEIENILKALLALSIVTKVRRITAGFLFKPINLCNISLNLKRARENYCKENSSNK